MDDCIAKQLCANAIGALVLEQLEGLRPEQLAEMAEGRAAALLRQIKELLDDDTLDDPTCFQRIDAIVTAFQDAGLSTRRHWACE